MKKARSGNVHFALEYKPKPLGGSLGHYIVKVACQEPALETEFQVGAPTALVEGNPEAKEAIEEIAETVAHFLLSSSALPVELSQGRVIIRA